MGIDWSGFKYGKTTRDDRKKNERRDEREFKKARKVCRRIAYNRAKGCCQHCGTALVLLVKNAAHEFQIANIHEHPSRAKGGDPTDPDICVCVCHICHGKLTHNELDIEWKDPAEKAKGGAIFKPKQPKGVSCPA
jgi:hypothetical protein